MIVPVVVDEAGEIIDGHHRAMIADSLGVEYPTRVMPGLSAHEKRVLAVSLNVDRRHLTDAQKVLLGKKIEPDVVAMAKERQGARTDVTGTLSSSDDKVPVKECRNKTVQKVAEQVGQLSRV